MQHLPELMRRMRALENALAELRARIGAPGSDRKEQSGA
jgi:hypothetical protein